MEIGKIEKFDLSTIRVHTKSAPFRLKLLNLDVGQGFVVDGVERGTIQAPVTVEHNATDKRFVITKLGLLPFKYQVVRVK